MPYPMSRLCVRVGRKKFNSHSLCSMRSCCGYGRGLSRGYSKSSNLMHLCGKVMHVACSSANCATAANCKFSHPLARNTYLKLNVAAKVWLCRLTAVFGTNAIAADCISIVQEPNHQALPRLHIL